MSFDRGDSTAIAGKTSVLAIEAGGTNASTANDAINNLLPDQENNADKYLKTDGTNTSWDAISVTAGNLTGTVAIANGGTGATDASTARTNLGLGTAATTDSTDYAPAAKGVTNGDSHDHSGGDGSQIAYGTLSGLPTLGTISSQDANNVTITGGSVTGITDLAVADGGTGASTLTGYVKGNGTSAFTASSTIPNTDITGLGTMSTQASSNVSITGGSITGITDLAIADGGTGASNAGTARTNLGATTVGSNLFTLTNPSAITFPRINANNTVSTLSATDFRTAIGAGTGDGTVTNVTGTSPVASSGGTTPAISLSSGYGDTQNPYASKTANFVLAAPNGTAGVPTFRAIVAADIPTLNQNTTGTASNVTGTVAIANGGTGATDAGTARTNLGLGSIATQAASNVSITGGSITGITDLAVADGGTGASTLTGYVKGNGTSAFTASSTIPNTDITGLGTISTQAASNVSITGGSITGITDLAVADGGTGASTAQNARINLLPTYTGNANKVLAVNTGATDVEWVTSGGMVYPSAGIAVSTGSAWGTSLTAPTGTIVGTSDTQTLTNKTLTDPTITGTIIEDVFTITDGAAFEVDPANGSVQLITLGASRTPKATNFVAGESVTLMVLDGTAYTITWTDATWGSGGVVWVGGSAPTLDTTKYTVIQFWKVSTQIYGALVGFA